MATSADKGRSDIRPGQHPVSSTGRVEGGDETYGVYGTKGYYKSFQPQFKGRPLKHTEMDFNIDLIGQVIKGYRVVGNSLVQDEIDLVADIDKVLMFAEREMLDENGDPVYEDDGVTPKIEYIWELNSLSSIAGTKGAKGATGAQGASGTTGAQGAKGATGAQGLTGVKGEVGAQGLQGNTGASAQANLVYLFTHNTSTPAAVPNVSASATFYQQNGALVISFTDNYLADNENKFLGLLATGTFDITVVSQSGGASVYNQYSFSGAYVDFSTFSASNCVVIYASTINASVVTNPNINATGNITFNGNLPSNIPTFSNVFIDKWNGQAYFLNLVVVPNSLAFESATITDQFIVIPPEFVGLKLREVTASWGALTCGADVDFEVILTKSSGVTQILKTYTHPLDTKCYSTSASGAITALGVITIECPTPPDAGSAIGYTVTLKFK